MAGDWIKFRVELLTHPKFLALSEDLIYGEDSGLAEFIFTSTGDVRDEMLRGVRHAASRGVTLASLLMVWGAVNTHCSVVGDDAIWENADIYRIDDIAGIVGFGKAMLAAGWVEVDSERNCLIFRNFLIYNVPACTRPEPKTGAERMRELRTRKTAGVGSKKPRVTNVTKCDADLEKILRPKDKTPPSPPAGGAVISLGSDPGGQPGPTVLVPPTGSRPNPVQPPSKPFANVGTEPAPRPLSARNPPIYSADPVGGREGSESERPISNRRRFGGKAGKALTESIYRAYPRHVGRGAALKSIERALETIADRPGAPADPGAWLLGRVTEYAKSEAGRAGTFTPHPATWFRRGSYDDDPAEWKRAGDDKVATKARESEAAKKAAEYARVQAERQRASAEAARAASNVMSPEEKAAWFDKAKAAIGARK